jgi:hypothetical protein
MEKKKNVSSERIRSELTHDQEVALVHSKPSTEVIEKIIKKLESLEEKKK